MPGKKTEKLLFDMTVDGEVITSLMFDQETATIVRDMAKQQRRSIQDQLRFLVDKGIEHLQLRTGKGICAKNCEQVPQPNIQEEMQRLIRQEISSMIEKEPGVQAEFLRKRLLGASGPNAGRPGKEENAA